MSAFSKSGSGVYSYSEHDAVIRASVKNGKAIILSSFMYLCFYFTIRDCSGTVLDCGPLRSAVQEEDSSSRNQTFS